MRKPVYAIYEQQRHRSSAPLLFAAWIVIPILAISKISRLSLVSVAEQAGLSLTWLQNPEDRISRDAAQ